MDRVGYGRKVGEVNIQPRYEFVEDCGTLYIHIWRGVASQTVVVPLQMAMMACELLQCCKSLLEFIKAHDMGGDWCQDNYPTIVNARATIAKAEDA